MAKDEKDEDKHDNPAHGNHNLTYSLMTQVEENLETAGITLGILAVLTHLGRADPRWLIRLDA